jgi:cytochrome c-type biogenesis protein CcmH/NrfG
MSEIKQEKQERKKDSGVIKKETMYIVVVFSLLIGFLSGVVLTVYKMPDGCEVPHGAAAPTGDHRQHNLVEAKQLVEENPGDSRAWAHLGHAYFDTGQHENAIAAYTKSLSIAPDDPDVMTDLGVMYRRNGQPDKALEVFAGVLKIAPEHEPSRFNKGVVLLFDKGDQDAAFKTWEKLLEINPEAVTLTGQPLGEFMSEMAKR